MFTSSRLVCLCMLLLLRTDDRLSLAHTHSRLPHVHTHTHMLVNKVSLSWHLREMFSIMTFQLQRNAEWAGLLRLASVVVVIFVVVVVVAVLVAFVVVASSLHRWFSLQMCDVCSSWLLLSLRLWFPRGKAPSFGYFANLKLPERLFWVDKNWLLNGKLIRLLY